MTQRRHINEITGLRSATDLTDGEVKTIASFVIANELRKPTAKYLEVGVFAGATIRFCKQYTKTTQFVGVDLFEDFKDVGSNTHTSGTFHRDDIQNLVGDRATFVKGNSDNVLPQLTDKFDFIFIDGNHTYEATMRDFKNSIPLLADGGQISFHNCSPYMGPDFELYGTKDGGPWLVCQDILMMKEWKLVESIDRLKVFKKL